MRHLCGSITALRSLFHGDIGETGHFADADFMLFLLHFAHWIPLTPLPPGLPHWRRIFLAANQDFAADAARCRSITGDLVQGGWVHSRQGRPSAAQRDGATRSARQQAPGFFPLGPVFRGANSDIGNAPEFVGKSVVGRSNVPVPGFLGVGICRHFRDLNIQCREAYIFLHNPFGYPYFTVGPSLLAYYCVVKPHGDFERRSQL